MNIAEAQAALAEVLPNDVSFCIHLDAWRHVHTDTYEEKTRHEFSTAYRVWDGTTHHDGVTVEQAVRKCIEAHTLANQDPDDALEEVPEDCAITLPA